MKKTEQTFIVSEEDAGGRLDVVLPTLLGLSRSQVQKLIKQSVVYINDIAADKAGHMLNQGDVIAIRYPEIAVKDSEDTAEQNAAALAIEIISETDQYLLINKPAGVLVHPTQAGETGTIAEWAVKKYPAIASVGESPERPGIVHRLDKEASGLLIIAKTQDMFEHLKRQFQERTMEKEYTVLVHGIMSKDHGVIDFDIDRGKEGIMVSRPHVNELSIKHVNAMQPGKKALTEYWLEKQYARYSLLKVRIHTGRTHQIRVHFFAFTHPVVGDQLYFNKKLNRRRDLELGRLFLHAKRLVFTDLDGKNQEFSIPLPEELRSFLATIK